MSESFNYSHRQFIQSHWFFQEQKTKQTKKNKKNSAILLWLCLELF